MAVEKGRKEAQKIFNNAISPSFKALGYDPFDVKSIFNPVDFVVFRGMNIGDNISEIVLLSKQCENTFLCQIREQVKCAVLKNEYKWQVARIDDNGSIVFE